MPKLMRYLNCDDLLCVVAAAGLPMKNSRVFHGNLSPKFQMESLFINNTQSPKPQNSDPNGDIAFAKTAAAVALAAVVATKQDQIIHYYHQHFAEIWGAGILLVILGFYLLIKRRLDRGKRDDSSWDQSRRNNRNNNDSNKWRR